MKPGGHGTGQSGENTPWRSGKSCSGCPAGTPLRDRKCWAEPLHGSEHGSEPRPLLGMRVCRTGTHSTEWSLLGVTPEVTQTGLHTALCKADARNTSFGRKLVT